MYLNSSKQIQRYHSYKQNLLSSQRNSFFWFIHESFYGLSYQRILRTKYGFLRISLAGGNKILCLPRITADEALRCNKTYGSIAYVPCIIDIFFYQQKHSNLLGQNSSHSILTNSGLPQITKNFHENEMFFYGKPISFVFPLKFALVPLMTNKGGDFVIRGIRRVIVNQLVRNPGVYYSVKVNKKGVRLYTIKFLFLQRSWLQISTDRNLCLWVEIIPRKQKIPVPLFLQVLGFTQSEIDKAFPGNEAFFRPTYNYLHNKGFQTNQNGKKLTFHESLKQFAFFMGFSGKLGAVKAYFLIKQRYISPFTACLLGKFGRRNLNDKFGIANNTTVSITPEDLLLAIRDLFLIHHGQVSIDNIDQLKNRRVRTVGELLSEPIQELSQFQKLDKFHYKRSQQRKRQIKKSTLHPQIGFRKIWSKFFLKTLVKQGVGLQNWMNSFVLRSLYPEWRKIFTLNPLSQLLDETNALASVTHKRRISCLGPGGLKRETAGFSVRDIHPSYYGKLCPIETPEGQNAGLISSLSLYSRLDKNGILESPVFSGRYRRCNFHNNPQFFSAIEDFSFRRVTSDYALQAHDFQLFPQPLFARSNEQFLQYLSQFVTAFDVSPCQILSVATALIPFVEHNDANRALMGSNMQRQAIPLLKNERPLIGTGLEAHVVYDSGTSIHSNSAGWVPYADSKQLFTRSFFIKPYQTFKNRIKLFTSANYRFQNISKLLQKGWNSYKLTNQQRTNQGLSYHHRITTRMGEWVAPGTLLAESFSSDGGELAVGKNLLLAYMPWEGYNFEDALVISESCIKNDMYTSFHIKKFETNIRSQKRGYELLTADIPGGIGVDTNQLNPSGIGTIGSWVKQKDILVGKLAFSPTHEPLPEERLLKAIFGAPVPTGKDVSLRMPAQKSGRILNISQTPTKGVRLSIGYEHRLQVGDKMAGRHGNKGIIAAILPEANMPYTQEGAPIDIILNPLGVPSRMNVGQVFEGLLGWSASLLGYQVRNLPFDEMFGKESSRSLIYQNLWNACRVSGLRWVFEPNHPGKSILFDGRTGRPFDQPIMITKSYMLKLNHLVEHKIHARSTGPYSLITQQPVGGRAKNGGQRFGEMEVWALEGYGAAYTLHELLTLKSDDLLGREKMLQALFSSETLPFPATPESFLVLVRELRSLCFDIEGLRLVK
uniref:DNA-directed RNA polymerase subunit beta n=1 Tax=Prasinoderma coloniale TaxID=156133 RepID=A0A088CIA2_9VIRI|nr:beta subunit of RNA polymerase [Prasinoderma coloniale]AID67555.1 beta subunit of RNA polymerase [Prasinoderma coloniale]